MLVATAGLGDGGQHQIQVLPVQSRYGVAQASAAEVDPRLPQVAPRACNFGVYPGGLPGTAKRLAEGLQQGSSVRSSACVLVMSLSVVAGPFPRAQPWVGRRLPVPPPIRQCTWWRDHADHHMGVLLSADGPPSKAANQSAETTRQTSSKLSPAILHRKDCSNAINYLVDNLSHFAPDRRSLTELADFLVKRRKAARWWDHLPPHPASRYASGRGRI